MKQLKDILESCSDPLVLVRNQDLAGCTLLHGAVRFDKVDVAELLLSFGAGWLLQVLLHKLQYEIFI